MPRKESDNSDCKRLADMLERLGTIGLYLFTDMGHHSIALRLGIETQRVNAILKGLKKPNGKKE